MDFHKNFLKVFKDESSIEKPIFIVGPPRSGTTITYLIMCAHPDLAWFSTYDIKYWVPRTWVPTQKIITIGNTLLKKPINRELQWMLNGPDEPGKNRSRLPSNLQPIEGNSFWNRIFKDWPKKDISNQAKLEIKKIISDTIKRQNKPRFLNKAPLHSTRLFVLKDIFPDAKFINLIRDPRATIASSLKRHEQEGGFAVNSWPIINKSKYETLDLIQKYAWLYSEVVDASHEFLEINKGNNFMTIIYEDFMKNPIETLSKMLNFCQLSIPKSLDDMIPPIQETTHKWKERFSIEDQKKIFDIVQPSINKMHYPYKI